MCKNIRINNSLVSIDTDCIKVFLGYCPSELGGSCLTVYRYPLEEEIDIPKLVKTSWDRFYEEMYEDEEY